MVCLDFQISCTSDDIWTFWGILLGKTIRISNENPNNINNLISGRKINCKRKLEKKKKFLFFCLPTSLASYITEEVAFFFFIVKSNQYRNISNM